MLYAIYQSKKRKYFLDKIYTDVVQRKSAVAFRNLETNACAISFTEKDFVFRGLQDKERGKNIQRKCF